MGWSLLVMMILLLESVLLSVEMIEDVGDNAMNNNAIRLLYSHTCG